LDAQPIPDEVEVEGSPPAGPWSVSKIYVHNFRTFVNFEWSPPSVCVLVGENGAGKTALLDVLRLLQDLLVRGSAINGADAAITRTRWLRDAEQIIELEMRAASDFYRYRLGIQLPAGQPTIREELHCNGGLLYRADLGQVELFGDTPASIARTTISFDRRRSFLAALEPRHDNQRLIAFRNAVGSILVLKPDASRIHGQAQGESTYLEHDLSNFASWFLSRVAEDLEATTLLMADLKTALRGFSTIRSERVSDKAKTLSVRFVFKEASYDLTWDELSDGQRLIIALYGLLHLGLANASLIIVDEAENFVGPSEIQRWLRAMGDSANERGQQLLYVSHNQEAINYLAADGIWRMWRDPDAGHTRIAPLIPDEEAGMSAYDELKLQLGGAAGPPSE
jgi:predicted ATPase